MTGKKVKLAFITNDSARKATFKKWKKGLMKKVSELSTLCGIDSCAIVYRPYDAQPDMWHNPRGAQRVLAQFKWMPEMEQSKKMVNRESFISHRILKAVDQLKKVHKENREKEITHLIYQCLTGKGMGMAELNDMGWLIDQNLKEIYKRLEGLRKPAAVVGEEKVAVVEDAVGGGMQRQQQWFAEGMGSTSDAPQQQVRGVFGHGGGEEMILPFSQGSGHAAAAMWSNVFFP